MSQNPYETPQDRSSNYGSQGQPGSAGSAGQPGPPPPGAQAGYQQGQPGYGGQQGQPGYDGQPGPGYTGQQGGYAGQPGQPGGYQPGQPGGYQQPVQRDGGLSTLQLNLWLSVFFYWIPALIFLLTSRDNSAPAVRDGHTKNMNFQIIRIIFAAISVIPYIGWLIGGIGSIVLFIFAVINAVQVPQQIRANRRPEFIMDNVTAPNWVK